MTEEVKVFDSSEPRDVQQRIKSVKQKDALLKEALRLIMSTQGGRAWMLSHLERCHPYQSPFSSDPILMAHNCGEANIGLQLIAELHEVSTELYLLMMKESKDA